MFESESKSGVSAATQKPPAANHPHKKTNPLQQFAPALGRRVTTRVLSCTLTLMRSIVLDFTKESKGYLTPNWIGIFVLCGTRFIISGLEKNHDDVVSLSS